jgi:hypothetical protein
MASPKNDITVEFVRSTFYYDTKTGDLFWKKSLPHRSKGFGGNTRGGRIAGQICSDGYRYIKIGKRSYLAHRLAYLHKNGEWPIAQIDHVANNTLDNRNIRPANNSQNGFNRGKQKNNTSGFKGVSYDKRSGKWRASIQAYGKPQELGLHKTKKDAYSAYCEAAKRLHGEFVNLG